MFSNSPLIGQYCGVKIPDRIPSFTNVLYIRFVSDWYISDKGFNIVWQQTSTGCGGKLDSFSGSIHSPHNAEISGEVVCSWSITVSPGSVINLNLTSNNPSALCRQNSLTIYDGPLTNSPTLKLNCTNFGDVLTLQSTSNKVHVRYSADGDGLKFVLDYVTNCNVIINSLQGIIESPNFPENYPYDLKCAWELRGGRKMSLLFSHLDVEGSKLNCAYDYIEVVDMRNDEVLSTQHLCSIPTSTITNSGSHLILKFFSDGSFSKKGFHAEFKVVGCGGHLTDNNGRIETPNAPYSVDIDCRWYIEVPSDRQIVLNINSIQFGSSKHCDSDYVIISESYNALEFNKQCERSIKPLIFTSFANRLFIHFHTSERREQKFLKASYFTKKADCGGTYHGGSNTISSPNYPHDKLKNIECVWYITVDDGKNILYGLNGYNVTSSLNCTSASITISEELNGVWTPKKPICGDSEYVSSMDLYNLWFSVGNQISITVKADVNSTAMFAFSYYEECHVTLTDTSGVLSSISSKYCKWVIVATEGSQINLNILHIECDGKPLHSLKIYDDSKTLLHNFCEEHTSHVIASSNLTIQAQFINFRASYSTIQTSCGGVITSLRGTLASPYYPSTYPSNVECVWDIRASKGNFIEINFVNLVMAESDRCNNDFLELRTTIRGKILATLCGKNMPTAPIVVLENIWIKFRSVEGSSGNGFKLTWNYAHDNLFNNLTGIIESPPVGSIATQEPYSWRIELPRDQLITLEFKEYLSGLNLYDGFSDIALKVEIPYSPWRFVSSTNVVFLNSINDELQPFLINWSAVSKEVVRSNQTVNKCGEDLIISFSTAVKLNSPGYPNGYDDNLHCTYIIKPEENIHHVVFELMFLDLEEISDCSADNVRVFSSSNLEDWHEELKVCNSKKEEIKAIATIRGTPYLKVEFKSDASINGTGFSSFLTTECGSNITNSNVGTIIGNHVMRSRLMNFTCLWHIEVRPGKQISVEFKFNRTISTDKDCAQYAIVYDGLDSHAPIFPPGHICQAVGHTVNLLTTSTNHAIIKYVLPFSWITFNRAQIWNITYREYSECDEEIYLTHYASYINISSPRYPNVPHPHTECKWIIIGPPGETLQLSFIDRFDMNSRYCDKEFIEIFDGGTDLAPNLGHFCRRPNIVRSTSNILTIHYFTDIAEPHNGFRVNASIARCGGSYNSMYGDITSLNYPALGAYPKNTICEYSIKLIRNARMILNFTDLHIPFNNNNVNNSDHLDIFRILDENTTELVTVIYGNETLPQVEIDGKEVLIIFSTFLENHNYRGFKINYKRISSTCYRYVSGLSGNIELDIPRDNSMPTFCRWKITVPKGQVVRFELLDTDRSYRLVSNNGSET
ncbi:cubilin homolog [Teleopsis dalmanni]|uniref:cubilin homolog n=1 Tax=Teleopsis dalmanni TaxID=139649 RepID=UPI0018CE8489|nr:cubilin homolog [Teleopsis dalmanni]